METNEKHERILVALKETNLSYGKIGKLFGLSRQRIQQIAMKNNLYKGNFSLLKVSDKNKILKEAEYICFYCKTTDATQVDHLVPIKKGGTDEQNNLVASCRHCNSSKGAKSLKEWSTEISRSLHFYEVEIVYLKKILATLSTEELDK